MYVPSSHPSGCPVNPPTSVTVGAGSPASPARHSPDSANSSASSSHSPSSGVSSQSSQETSSTGTNNPAPSATDAFPTPQTSAAIYAYCLQGKHRGFPLWIPSPNMRLPASYRTSGVSIGDVGVITPEGGFSYFFKSSTRHRTPSIWRCSSRRILSRSSPEGHAIYWSSRSRARVAFFLTIPSRG